MLLLILFSQESPDSVKSYNTEICDVKYIFDVKCVSRKNKTCAKDYDIWRECQSHSFGDISVRFQFDVANTEGHRRFFFGTMVFTGEFKKIVS